MNVLVTGGAGYVGSVVSEHLAALGHMVIVLDNLQQGHRDAVLAPAEFIQGDIGDGAVLDNIFSSRQISAVVHLAAETLITYSMTDPGKFFRGNVVNAVNLLDAMLRRGVKKIIFSSSAAVYGECGNVPVGEDDPKLPVNSYGESKLMFENILKWYGNCHGLQHVSLRYFNAAGASEALGERHHPETHLIPNVLSSALHKGGPVKVCGGDYPIPDGSCIRDYVHVVDIAQAHALALDKLGSLSGHAFNLGTGKGYSVLEVIEAARRTTGVDIPFKVCARRPGDPSVLVASPKKAMSELGWEPLSSGLASIIDTAWKWMCEHKSFCE